MDDKQRLDVFKKMVKSDEKAPVRKDEEPEDETFPWGKEWLSLRNPYLWTS